jgi:FHA domain/RING-variant domain
MTSYLEIQAYTWLRDTQGLYDYDSSYLTEDKLKIDQSGSILRKGNELTYKLGLSSPSDGILLNIFEKPDGYLVYPPKQDCMGLVVKELKNKIKGYKLKVGDMIKIGKVSLKVKETFKSLKKKNSFDECEGSNTGDITCRICFRTHSNSIDPLLSLCDCSGTMGLTHLYCLQKWVLLKCVKKVNAHTITYSWKNFNCDICKKTFPLTFLFEDKEYNLVSVPTPTGKFIILEDLRTDKFKYLIHVINPELTPVLIGRSNECDLKINDISVSRSHATISYLEDQFYIQDNLSKFGTLVLLSNPIHVKLDNPVVIQINRTLFKLSLKKKSRLAECCKKLKKKKINVEPFPRGRTPISWEEQSLQSPNNQNLN